MELQLLQDAHYYEISNDTATVFVQNEIQTVKTSHEVKSQLQALLEKGGPDKSDYKMLSQVISDLHLGLQSGLVSQQEIDSLKSLFKDEFLDHTIHGHGYRKPMGYAGDYLLIDKIYTYAKTAHAQYEKWDKYFHTLDATEAVRNRKEYFKEQLSKKVTRASNTLNLLDVASGPARDVHELYQMIDAKALNTTCVDMDTRAIEHAKHTCKDELDQIQFYNKNILRFTTEEKFDVIWSAGLFDYFDDRVFVLVMKKFLSWLKPGGEIIVGNFSEDNCNRGYMEMFGEWILIHRSKEELTQLAVLAGAKKENVWVDQEPLGINLFLRITG